MISRRIAALALVCACAFPALAFAFPFGGQAGTVLPCVFNSTIYTVLGPPIGGSYVWTTATRTYQFGPPKHSGQYAIGLAAPPYYCIFSIAPIITFSGIAMTMVGTSQ